MPDCVWCINEENDIAVAKAVEAEREKAEVVHGHNMNLVEALRNCTEMLSEFRASQSKMNSEWAEASDDKKKTLWRRLHELEDWALDTIAASKKATDQWAHATLDEMKAYAIRARTKQHDTQGGG